MDYTIYQSATKKVCDQCRLRKIKVTLLTASLQPRLIDAVTTSAIYASRVEAALPEALYMTPHRKRGPVGRYIWRQYSFELPPTVSLIPACHAVEDWQ